MKNIITIALILILPVLVYFVMSKNSNDITVFAKDMSKPSMYVFSSTMCMDCQKVKTLLKEIQPDYVDKINIVHINAIENTKKTKELVKKHNVVLVPTIVFLDVNNSEINRIEGYMPKEEFIKEIEESING